MRLTRNAERVKQVLRELPTGQLYTAEACRIQVPVRYTDRGLGEIGIETYIFGFYALILEDGSYAVSTVPAMIKIEPFKIVKVTVNGVPYHEFHFKPNSILSPSLNLIRRDVLMYNLIDEFIFQGNVPWFMDYEDMCKIFDLAKHHAGSNIAASYETFELIASVIARDSKDRHRYYCMTQEKEGDLRTRPEFVPLKSVFYSATNTLNKLAGAYFGDGVLSALVQPTHEVEHVEQLLRA